MAKLDLGNRIAPARFVVFALLTIVGVPIAARALGWRLGLLAGFDVAAVVFLASLLPILSLRDARAIRAHGRENEANRPLIVAITVAVMLVVLAAVALELSGRAGLDTAAVALIVSTLVIAWVFSNVVFALHYAHLFYTPQADGAGDSGGLDFPGTAEPDYLDFVYFAFTLGMCFQTADVAIRSGRFRRVAIGHCLAAFVFDLGVLAFSINVLGGS